MQMDSDALYYPYIHIQDDNWLKVTLLFFAHILRMVPPGLDTQDSSFVKGVSEQLGRQDRPLLEAYAPSNIYSYDRIDKLLERLLTDQEADPSFASRFSRTATCKAYGSDDKYLIHRGKAPEHFWKALSRLGFIWNWKPTSRSGVMNAAWHEWLLDPEQAEQWYALHPIIGEVFMATIATVAAQHHGLEIVTDSSRIHSIATSRDENLIYSNLIHGKKQAESRIRKIFKKLAGNEIPKATYHLTQLIVTGNFDLSNIGPQEIAKLSMEKDALVDFRKALAERVSSIPEMDSETALERYYVEAAKDVIQKWRQTHPNLSNLWKKIINGSWSEKGEKPATELAKELVHPSASAVAAGTGASLLGSPAILAVGAGLVVGAISYVFSSWRNLRADYNQGQLRYLSMLQKQGATLLVAPPAAPVDLLGQPGRR